MAQVEQSSKGKQNKGAQKKKQIHVDFTPMVDMNMLLITFFMLCTTMIKPQTLNIALPTNEKPKDEQQGTKAKESDALTLILDTEYDENGHVVVDEDGRPVHKIYWYAGKPLDDAAVEDVVDPNTGLIADVAMVDAKLNIEKYVGNNGAEVNGIRKILHQRNEGVLEEINKLKEDYKAGKIAGATKDEQKAEFDRQAALIRGAKKDTLNNPPQYDYSYLQRPVVIIKPGPNASFENVLTALDEMQINQIGQYQLNTINGVDSLLINSYKHFHPEDAK